MKRGFVTACALALWLGAAGVPDAVHASGGYARPAESTRYSSAQQGFPGYAQRTLDTLTHFLAAQLACGRHRDPFVLLSLVGALHLINLIAILTPPPQPVCND